MVEYYNMSALSDAEGFMGVIKFVSSGTTSVFGYGLIALVFVLPLIVMVRKQEDLNSSIHVCSLYAGLTSIFFYLSGIINNIAIIFVFAVVYAVTLAIRWSNKR